MSPSDTRQLIASVLAGIAPEANLAGVGEGEDLRQALDLDSMDFLNFIIGLSAGSGISIAESDYPKLYSLGGLLAYFAAR